VTRETVYRHGVAFRSSFAVLDERGGKSLRSKVALIYVFTSALCALMPHIAAAVGLAQLPWWPPALPVAYASLALGVTAWSRAGSGQVEWVVALLWSIGAVALATPLSAPPRDLDWLFPAIRAQAFLAGSAAVGTLGVAALTIRAHRGFIPRLIEVSALLALAGLLARGALRTLLPASTYAGGLAEIEWEIHLFRAVVATSATALLVAGLAARARRPSET
jgi:hypothetical protein